YLASEQDVLARLGHDAVRCGDHEDGTVHLGGARDHVLDVVSVTRRVYVSVVALRRLVLRVRERDGDTTRLLFRSLIDVIDTFHARRVTVAGLRENVQDRRGKSGLAVVDVTDRADVDVRLIALEFFCCHMIDMTY